MWSYYPELLERPVPRYTSFPTAAEFRPLEHDRVMDAALAAIPSGAQISLYVHIPYCNEICYYCACNTGRANKKKRLQSYIEALIREIELVGERIAGPINVSRIAFGGGSPNAIDPGDFVRILDQLRASFDAKFSEISVELDPRDFTADWAETLSESGVTHASMGVQTFAPQVQQAIGRVQPTKLIATAIQQLRDKNVSSINFDMMYGLPAQTLSDLRDSLDQAIALQPDRIALFGYAHLPDRIPRQRRIDSTIMANQIQRFEMAALGYEHLVDAGYQAIGFDHFALPDDPMAQAARAGTISRNFQGFTDDPAPYLIGLGASAISIFPDHILQNEKNVGKYRDAVFAGKQSAQLGVQVSEEDRLHRQIIEDVLCRGRANIGTLSDASRLTGYLESFEKRKLLTIEDTEILCSDNAAPYLRTIAAIFDPYRIAAGTKFSSAI